MSRWFNYDDERLLLRFDSDHVEAQRRARNAFRSLYLHVPGYDPPTSATAEARDFTVQCYVYPEGIEDPEDPKNGKCLTWHRKMPAGVLNKMFRGEGGLEFGENLRLAVCMKHQLQLEEYCNTQGWTCARCAGRCAHVSCKSVYDPAQSKFSLYACLPQCGGEACRIALQRQADNYWSHCQRKLVASSQSSPRSSTVPSPNAQDRPATLTLRRACEACGKTGEEGTEIKACTRCRATFYCSVACQKKHWSSVHKFACRPVEEE